MEPSKEYNEGIQIGEDGECDWRIIQVEFSAAYAISHPKERWRVVIESPDGEYRHGSSPTTQAQAALDAIGKI